MREVLYLPLTLLVLLTGCTETQGPARTEEISRGDSAKTAPASSANLIMARDLNMSFIIVPRGEFIMGSNASEQGSGSDEHPAHTVRILRPFYMGKYEVTRQQFGLFVSAAGYVTDAEKNGWVYARDGAKREKVQGISWRAPGFEQDANDPVVCVSFNDAKAFCDWLGRQQVKRFRLPSEAEWEYACRANSTSQFSFGFDETMLSEYGSYSGNSTGPQKVGSKRANAFGLYDMHGNIWEWCGDWYDSKYYSRSPAVAPIGPTSGNYRVLRGGSWFSDAKYCRSANRSYSRPDEASATIGFRVVLEH